MRYLELTAAVPAQESAAAADVLAALFNTCASIEAPFDQPDLESDARPSDGTAFVRVYLPESAIDASGAAAEELSFAGLHHTSLHERLADEEDWAEAWKEHFHVTRFGDRIVVVPSWREYVPQPGDAVVTLDPGMAFGTGQHETTRMCLEALDRAVRPGMRVLDAGCGSGILALATARLGAVVHAVDIDSDCVRITRENARSNGLEPAISVAEAPAAGPWGTAGPFDIVVANIIARVIVDAAPALASALTPGGLLIASGVVAAREDEVRAALTSAGLTVGEVRAMGEWRCFEAYAR